MARLFFLIAVTILLAMGSAVAQERVPSGCFVTDEERARYSGSYNCSNCAAPACYNEGRVAIAPWSPDNGFTNEQILQLYGFQYGDLVLTTHGLFYKWQNAEARTAAQKSLVTRLRKACGTKCRRIK